MTQKMDLSQLESKTLEEIKAYKADISKRQAELITMKKKNSKAWKPEMQEELDELALFSVDVDELIEQKENEKDVYTPEEGTESMVHLLIREGNRFSSVTGKPLHEPYKQLFTYGEWQLFKVNMTRLGFSIVEVLFDPFNEASAFVQNANNK